MKKIIFEKNYTRDTALFLQDIWARDQAFGLARLLGKENPYLPGIIHYVNNGSIEIWEHDPATRWLMDTLLEKNNQDQSFFYSMTEAHLGYVKELEVYWNKGVLTTVQELKELGVLIEKACTGFNIFYRTAFDERSPKELRDRAMEIRKNDVFFSKNDTLILKSMPVIFPHLAGYGNYIFANEIDAVPDLETLKKRKESFVVEDGTTHFLGTIQDFAATHPAYEFKMEKVEEGISEIKGQSAFKGKVTGTVKLVFLREQLGKVNIGDIMVSPMTTPDLLQAMEKAAAFVTDEGGITCHAAIVAREMKKPCIIGTKIATKVLKDGDMVEVDAEKGIVTILS